MMCGSLLRHSTFLFKDISHTILCSCSLTDFLDLYTFFPHETVSSVLWSLPIYLCVLRRNGPDVGRKKENRKVAKTLRKVKDCVKRHNEHT